MPAAARRLARALHAAAPPARHAPDVIECVREIFTTIDDEEAQDDYVPLDDKYEGTLDLSPTQFLSINEMRQNRNRRPNNNQSRAPNPNTVHIPGSLWAKLDDETKKVIMKHNWHKQKSLSNKK